MAISQPNNSINIGNTGRIEDVSSKGCRTEAQWAAVMEWHRDNPSAYWVGNPFHSGLGKHYRLGFSHTYVNLAGSLCGIWVYSNGDIRPGETPVADRGKFSAEADNIVNLFGAFRG